MTIPSLPTGYDVAKHVPAGRSDCHITVGFDRDRDRIPRFLLQLQYQTETDPVTWTAIARMDHNETSRQGHDVYDEGLHIDIRRRSKRPIQLSIPHAPLPANRGQVIRGCVTYLRGVIDYVIDVYEERRSPGRPPRWSPNGGDPTRTFISPNPLESGMRRDAPAEDAVIFDDELTELLAGATDSTPEEIERGADEMEIAPLEEADVIGYGGADPPNDSDSNE